MTTNRGLDVFGQRSQQSPDNSRPVSQQGKDREWYGPEGPSGLPSLFIDKPGSSGCARPKSQQFVSGQKSLASLNSFNQKSADDAVSDSSLPSVDYRFVAQQAKTAAELKKMRERTTKDARFENLLQVIHDTSTGKESGGMEEVSRLWKEMSSF